MDHEEAISTVELYKDYLGDIYSNKPVFQVAKLNAMIRTISNWSFLYWDNIHHNDDHGIPFLQNCFPSFVFQYSNNLRRSETKKNYNSGTQFNSTNRNHPYSRSRICHKNYNGQNKLPLSHLQGHSRY